MESFVKDLGETLSKIELVAEKHDEFIEGLQQNMYKYLDRARDILKKKQIINPKPQKRFARIIENASEDEENEETEADIFRVPAAATSKPVEDVIPTLDGSLRPIRSAKTIASKNLKEIPTNLKMRNDNNTTVIVKTERSSGASLSNKSSRESLKENSIPKKSAPIDNDDDSARRSASVEIIANKPVEIDITNDDSDRSMPPPPLPPKQKRGRPKKNIECDQGPRFTRSKIKKEKPSMEKSQSSQQLPSESSLSSKPVRKSASDSSVLLNQNNAKPSTKVNDEAVDKTIDKTIDKKKGEKKKYPMPMLIKMEKLSDATESLKISEKEEEEVEKSEAADKTFDFPVNEPVTLEAVPNNETITLSNAPANVNETVTLEKNPHDSLMTEDNDDEDEGEASMYVPLSKFKTNPLPQLKLKKNEVFNAFMASPVKQRVQAFEKHAIVSMTPEKGKNASSSSSKYNVLKAGTPSKIALYTSTSKTTPMSIAKQKYIATVSSASSATSAASSSTSSGVKKSTTKKFTTSMSLDSQEELKKSQAVAQTQAQIEERRRQREEKQRQVQLQREALEKHKREQTIQQQRERDEKFKRIMQEKEEQKRTEAMKKKAIKENQERKYAEERARKDEQGPSKPVTPHGVNKDDSLQIKMQKQIMSEKSLHREHNKPETSKKHHDKNTYSFDMLNTDDSTDDEGNLAKKRPDPPSWSKNPYRKACIIAQSNVNPDLLDTLFSVQPINVDLRAIFPSIEAKKLIRNSSAVWNTPPRYSVYSKNFK